MKPKRIQLSRKKGWRMPPNTVNVARPSRFGNAHKIGFCSVCGVEHTREEAIAEFEAELKDPMLILDGMEMLRGKDLACWCKLSDPCHADTLLRIANVQTDNQRPPVVEAGTSPQSDGIKSKKVTK